MPGLKALCAAIVASVSSCWDPMPTARPVYIGEVAAVRAGEGTEVWFALADEDGADTTAAGSMTLELLDGSKALFSVTRHVQASDFARGEVGMGPFAREKVICNLGRISDSAYSPPSGDWIDAVVIFVLPDGEKLTGKGSYHVE